MEQIGGKQVIIIDRKQYVSSTSIESELFSKKRTPGRPRKSQTESVQPPLKTTPDKSDNKVVQFPTRQGRLRKSTGEQVQLGKRKNELLHDSEGEDFNSNAENLNSGANRAALTSSGDQGISLKISIPMDDETEVRRYNTRPKRQKLEWNS